MSKVKTKTKDINVAKVDGKIELTFTDSNIEVESGLTILDLEAKKTDAIASRESASAQFNDVLAIHDAGIAKIDKAILDAKTLGF